MHTPTEAELQRYFDEAQLASDQAAVGAGTPNEGSAQRLADECWAYFHSALGLWESANPDKEFHAQRS